MLIVDAPNPSRAPISPEHAIRIPVAASVVMHAAIAALLLVRLAPRTPAVPPPIEVELIQQEQQVRGAAASRSQPAKPAPTPAPSPSSKRGEQPAPQPAPQSPPTPPSPPSPEVNLGDANRDLDPLTVTGHNVIPPRPDSRFHNQPPHYPVDAARAGAEGTVRLIVRVSPAGVPLDIAVAGSSGNSSLDDEARRAVLLWRFRPAYAGGEAVPFNYPVNIRFTLGERR